MLKDIMLVDKNEHILIYGKTGTGNKDNSWFVGMIEKGAEKYFFAVNLNNEKNSESSGAKAKDIALAALMQIVVYYSAQEELEKSIDKSLKRMKEENLID